MVNGRDIPTTLDELHEKLITRETALNATADLDGSPVPITANATQFRHQPQRSFSSSRGGFSSSRGGFSARGGFRPPRPYLGKCQICGTQGHSARRCPQLTSISAPSQFASSPNLRAPPPGFAPIPLAHWQNQAHHVTASSTDISPWLLDSGASHHIASDLSNLSLHSPYQGNENVMIGNGTGLQITHTGSTSLPSHSRNLNLNDVLCVPAMKTNLILVNKLCKTNNVMVQLCPSSFQVKDLNTGTTLLKGKANEGGV